MNTPLILHEYWPLPELASQPRGWWENVLGVVGFGEAPEVGPAQIPMTGSMTPVLGAGGPLCEVWRVVGAASDAFVTSGSAGGGVQYRHCGEFLFGSVTIAEQGLVADGAEGASAALRQATERAYREIFEVLRESGYRHLIRVWNYLPDINVEADGDERYRHFNSARMAAFVRAGHATEGSVPAASALGSAAGKPLSIYFLAGRHRPTMIENPRQISAYYYPPEYGIHQPLFSRACVLDGAAGTNLFVSGTASIVGHETIHRGDVKAQTEEALVNIGAVLHEANRRADTDRYALQDLCFKVYVRRPEDLPIIQRAMAGKIGRDTRAVYLHADVCREELLVEIEATGGSGSAAC